MPRPVCDLAQVAIAGARIRHIVASPPYPVGLENRLESTSNYLTWKRASKTDIFNAIWAGKPMPETIAGMILGRFYDDNSLLWYAT